MTEVDRDPAASAPLPRGRHAPPLEVRIDRQRRRLFAAAADVFAQAGFADATAEAISRAAGMSKATFYEHFANKEECILALFDAAAQEIFRAMTEATGERSEATSYEQWCARGLGAFLGLLAANPTSAQTLLVQIVGAGPQALQRRDAIYEAFAQWLHRDNAEMAPRFDAPTFASPDDAFAVIGGIVEIVSRQLRTGQPQDIRDLEPVAQRLLFGVLAQSQHGGLQGR